MNVKYLVIFLIANNLYFVSQPAAKLNQNQEKFIEKIIRRDYRINYIFNARIGLIFKACACISLPCFIVDPVTNCTISCFSCAIGFYYSALARNTKRDYLLLNAKLGEEPELLTISDEETRHKIPHQYEFDKDYYKNPKTKLCDRIDQEIKEECNETKELMEAITKYACKRKF